MALLLTETELQSHKYPGVAFLSDASWMCAGTQRVWNNRWLCTGLLPDEGYSFTGPCRPSSPKETSGLPV